MLVTISWRLWATRRSPAFRSAEHDVLKQHHEEPEREATRCLGLSPWQEAVGHEIIPDTHKNGCANEATTGLTLGLFVMLFQDVVFG